MATSEGEVRAIPVTERDECEVEGFVFSSGGSKVSTGSQRLRETSKSLRIT